MIILKKKKKRNFRGKRPGAAYTGTRENKNNYAYSRYNVTTGTS